MRLGFPSESSSSSPGGAPSSQGRPAIRDGILRAEDHRATVPGELRLLLAALESREQDVLSGLRALGRLSALRSRRRFSWVTTAPGGAAQCVRWQAAQGVGERRGGRPQPAWAVLLGALGERVSVSGSRCAGMLALSSGDCSTPPRRRFSKRNNGSSSSRESCAVRAGPTSRGGRDFARLTGQRAELGEPLPPSSGSWFAPRAYRTTPALALLAAQAADPPTLSSALRSPDPLLPVVSQPQPA
jgi:hypothetical protein